MIRYATSVKNPSTDLTIKMISLLDFSTPFRRDLFYLFPMTRSYTEKRRFSPRCQVTIGKNLPICALSMGICYASRGKNFYLWVRNWGNGTNGTVKNRSLGI